MKIRLIWIIFKVFLRMFHVIITYSVLYFYQKKQKSRDIGYGLYGMAQILKHRSRGIGLFSGPIP